MKFAEFEKLFHASQEKLEHVVQEFPWTQTESYAQWLANSYHYVNNSTRILALAAGHMPSHLTPISNRFISHAAEEKGHEKLLENDLKALGYRLSDLPVSNEMKLYYRSLYYWMSPAGNPVGLIGWVLSLEGLAAKAGPWGYQVTQKAFSGKATTFLRVHSDADPDHLDKALKVASSLGEEDLRVVCDAMLMYSEQYIQVMKALSTSVSYGKAS